MKPKAKEIIDLLDSLSDEAAEKVLIFISGMKASKGIKHTRNKPHKEDDSHDNKKAEPP